MRSERREASGLRYFYIIVLDGVKKKSYICIMKTLRKPLLTAALCLTTLHAAAGPAWKGTLTLRQPDGQTIQARLSGDEFGHVMKDLAGNALVQNSDGFWCYALYSSDGSIHSSGTPAGTGVKPSSASSMIPYDKLNMAAAEKRRKALMQRTRPAAQADGQTEHRCLILLADFPDLKMTYRKEKFDGLINGSANSARNYFTDQFCGKEEFQFDIAPIVTLSRPHDYYGKNGTDGSDAHAAEAVAEACTLAHELGTDFSRYDCDGDGTVDNVFVFVAGKDEAEGGGDNCIWSHAWALEYADIDLTLDGKRISGYAISTELGLRQDGRFLFTTIGTFCHEYSHTLGLMDMYDTDMEASGGKSECLWGTTSLMDSGNYNNEGRTPPNYNAIDRDMLGAGQPEELKEGRYTLEPIEQKGRFLRYDTGNEGEYFLIECRAKNGWDRYIGGNGLAIYHIDKSSGMTGWSPVLERDATAAERWSSNEVNCRPAHQCADMMEAYPKAANASQVFWPYGRNNTFSSQSDPAFRLWDGTYPQLSITDIVTEGDNVSFTVVKTGSITPAKVISHTEDIFQDTAIIQWSTDDSGNAPTATVAWGPSGKETAREEIEPYAPGQYAIRLEGLKPSSAYTVRIWFEAGGVKGKETTVNFTSKRRYEDGYPFIYLNNAKRNSDGSFQAGADIPLVVFNHDNAIRTEWFMDGRSIIPGRSGYYRLTRSCTIRAKITYVDGATDIIEKEIRLK